MWKSLRQVWFPAILFLGTLSLAAVLGLLVILGPEVLRLAGDYPDLRDSRLLQVFARDITVRRTALAGSLGLAVTALVFFRPTVLRGKKSRTRRPPPSSIAGA